MNHRELPASGSRVRYLTVPSGLGTVLVAANERGICAILLGDDAAQVTRDLRSRYPGATPADREPRLERLLARVLAMLATPAGPHALPLDPAGTPFQQRVWGALREIGPGTTVSYGGLARRIGAPGAARAVARACAANPLAVAIPCHRVIRQDGRAAGYRWGAARRELLLRLEVPE